MFAAVTRQDITTYANLGIKMVYAVGIEPTVFLMSRVTVCRHTTNSSLTYI